MNRYDSVWAMITDPTFWVAMFFAITVKIRSAPKLSLWGRMAAALLAVAAAVVFTVPVMEALDLEGDEHRTAIAALCALTGEHLARQVLSLSLLDVIRAITGKRGSGQ